MDPKIVESELRSHKIREGPIYKRTKFLQEWRERWMVLTMNFVLVFTNKNQKELTEFIDLRDVKAYKSYVRKDDEMIPAGFKLNTHDDMYYFCARNCNEKWSWLVSIERLMDFKFAGKSPYNNSEWIKTKGFMSQGEFERGKFDDPYPQVKEVKEQKPKVEEKPKPVEAKTTENDLAKLKKELEESKAKLDKQLEESAGKEKQQEEIFLFELNKLKKAEESLKEIQLEAEQKLKQANEKLKHAEELLAQHSSQQPKEIIVEKRIQVIVEKPVEVIVEKPVEVIVEKKVEVLVEKKIQIAEKPAEKQEQPAQLAASISKKESKGNRVSQIAKFYQNKIEEDVKVSRTNTTTIKPLANQSKEEQKPKDTFLHQCRSQIVINLFEEFHSKSYSYSGLKTILQFLIKMGAERSLGYQQYLVRECKASQNRYLFAEALLELISDYKDYQSGDSLCRVIELLIFEAPGIFKVNHFDLIKRKLTDIFAHTKVESNIAIVLKTMYVVHKLKAYAKDQQFKKQLQVILESKYSEETKSWARKLIDEQ